MEEVDDVDVGSDLVNAQDQSMAMVSILRETGTGVWVDDLDVDVNVDEVQICDEDVDVAFYDNHGVDDEDGGDR